MQPLSPYGRSKVDGEQLVAAYNAYDKIRHAVNLRFFNVYGLGQNPVLPAPPLRQLEYSW